MTSGAPVQADPTMIEPWRERTPQRVLAQQEARIRERVTELYAQSEHAKSPELKKLTRRCLIDAERLCQVAEAALREDWLRG